MVFLNQITLGGWLASDVRTDSYGVPDAPDEVFYISRCNLAVGPNPRYRKAGPRLTQESKFWIHLVWKGRKAEAVVRSGIEEGTNLVVWGELLMSRWTQEKSGRKMTSPYIQVREWQVVRPERSRLKRGDKVFSAAEVARVAELEEMHKDAIHIADPSKLEAVTKAFHERKSVATDQPE